MARGRKRSRPETFVQMRRGMLDSDAYKNLTFSAAKLLPLMMSRIMIDPDREEYYKQNFLFSKEDALDLGFSKNTFYRAKDELIGARFIEQVVKGGKHGNKKVPNQYRLSAEWDFDPSLVPNSGEPVPNRGEGFPETGEQMEELVSNLGT